MSGIIDYAASRSGALSAVAVHPIWLPEKCWAGVGSVRSVPCSTHTCCPKSPSNIDENAVLGAETAGGGEPFLAETQ